MGKPARSQEFRDEIVRRYTVDHQRAPHIARSMRIGITTVYRILDDAGIQRETSGRRALTPPQEAELLARYQAGRERVPALLAEFGINAGTLRNLRIRHGVHSRTKLPAHNRLMEDAVEQEIVRLYESGLSQAKIAAQYGVSQSAITRVLRRLRHTQQRDYISRREDHGQWKGGRVTLEGGYVGLRPTQDDPFLCMVNTSGYVLEHRYVMALSIGRPLARSESVHHINGDRADNRLENLQLRTGQHGKGVVFACLDCGSHNVGPVPIAD